MLDRTIEPQYQEPTSFNLHIENCDHAILDNGVPVYSVNGNSEEVIYLELVFDAGNWFDSKPLTAVATNQLLKAGTNTKSAFEWNEAFEFEGAYVNRSCQNETASIKLNCLARKLPKLLPLLREQITEAIFPEDEIKIYQQNSLQALSVNLEKADFLANRMIDKYIYGYEHPYGIYYNKEDYESIDRNLLLAYYEQYYKKGNCRIFAAGKLPNNFLELLNQTFGDLPIHFHPDSFAMMSHQLQPSDSTKLSLINNEESVQAAIRIGRPFIDRKHPDFADLSVLNTIFGGYFGSRLMSNIREEKGYTYGIYSYFQMHKAASAWIITTETKRNKKEETIDEIWKEADLLKTKLIDEEELNLVKNYLIGSILPTLDGSFQTIDRWKSYILNNLTEADFYHNLEAIKNISGKRIQQLANQYLNRDNFYEIDVI